MRITTFITLLAAALVLIGGDAAAQQGGQSVVAPVLTFIPDGAGGLRPVMGVAASASIGDPLNLGFEVKNAAVPPGHDYVIATAAGSDWPVWLQVNTDAVTARSLNWIFSLSNIDAVALSPTGAAAALFNGAERRVYTARNMASAPAMTGIFDIPSNGRLTALGISDDGLSVAVGVSDGTAGGLFLHRIGERSRYIASMGRPSAISFLRNGHDAVIADGATNTIYKLSQGYLFPIAGVTDGISAPVGVAVSNDNQKIFVANAAAGSVTAIPAHGGAAQTVDCGCRVSGLYPTSTDSVFRITEFTGGPVLLFDGGGTAPRVMFVRVGSGS